MAPADFTLNLPEWYRLERETGRTLEKLTSLKELEHYLKDGDEFVRRLALVRLSQIMPRDCGSIVGKMLDDSNESSGNRELAAWLLKAAALKWDLEIFTDSSYLAGFTGNENMSDLFRITRSELHQPLRFRFRSGREFMQLPSVDTNNSTNQNNGSNGSNASNTPEGLISLDSPFDCGQWLTAMAKGLLRMLAVLLRLVFLIPPKLLLIGLKKLISLAARVKKTSSTRKTSSTKETSSTRKTSRTKHTVSRRQTENRNGNLCSRLDRMGFGGQGPAPALVWSHDYRTYGQAAYGPAFTASLFSALKKAAFNILYVLFFPVRLILKFKLALVIILILAYMFLNFTMQGRILFREYTGKEFLQVQTDAIDSVRNFSVSIWKGFVKYAGLDAVLDSKEDGGGKSSDNSAGAVALKLYSVTAANGLNIRKAPDPNSKKISGGPLSYGSTVTFLGKTVTDTSGRIWHYIKAEDGRSGWVSAKYLSLAEEG